MLQSPGHLRNALREADGPMGFQLGHLLPRFQTLYLAVASRCDFFHDNPGRSLLNDGNDKNRNYKGPFRCLSNPVADQGAGLIIGRLTQTV